MRFRPGRFLALLTALAAPAALRAQGFGLNEIGSCAVSRASAATGAPCDDASTLFWNPAAGTRLQKGISVYGGAASVQVRGNYTPDFTTTGRFYRPNIPTEFPPHLFVNWRGAGRYAAGLGVYVPYGLTSQWRDDFPGRFSALHASIATIYIQPNVSIDLTPSWAIGGGPVFGTSTVELSQSLDLSQQSLPGGGTFASLGIAPGTEFARAMLKGSATGYGFHVGVHGKIGNTLQVGGRFISSMAFEYDDATARFQQVATNLVIPDATVATALGTTKGTSYDYFLAPQFRKGAPLSTQGVKTIITHPGQFEIGLGYTAPTGTLVSFDYGYILWKKFDLLPVQFQGPAASRSRTLIEDYHNSGSYRLGLEQKFSQFWNLTGRAGFSLTETPAP
ncbi:MAG TPA: outer membrane protein transport protein, partial [Gemmatimonadaceae bacterium]|nr:outer membrane protein transport protein [Gemmatimonadaceae bacterium]